MTRKTKYTSIFRIIFIVASIGIIPARYIAGVMNDGKFSAGLINESTQIVMMDEWTPDCLGCDDAKRILQGRCTFILRVYYYVGLGDLFCVVLT